MIEPNSETYSIQAIWDSEAGVYYSLTEVPGSSSRPKPSLVAIAEELLEANRQLDVTAGRHIVSGTFHIAV